MFYDITVGISLSELAFRSNIFAGTGRLLVTRKWPEISLKTCIRIFGDTITALKLMFILMLKESKYVRVVLIIISSLEET